MCTFRGRYLIVVLALSSVASARLHHKQKYTVVTTRPSSIQGAPQSTDADELDSRARWSAIEAEDARRGLEADRTRGVKRFPDVDIANLSRDGNIWVGGEPGPRGYQQLHDRGVDAIVDLRNPTRQQRESARQARRLGMDYINLPIEPKSMADEDADEFVQFMREHEGKQVLIHCGSANRASGMYAVYLGVVKGLSTDEAIRRARQTGLREQSLEEDARDYLDHRPANRPEPKSHKPAR